MVSLLLLVAFPAQQVPVLTLAPPVARSAEGFTNIFDVRELADGRVLLTDNLDNAIRIVDFDDGSVRQLGRQGAGPREYRATHTILSGNGDTLLVADNAQRRFVVIVRGEVVATRPQPDILRAQQTFSAPLAAGGRIFYDVRSLNSTASGLRETDGFVMSWGPGDSRLDTVARLPVENRARRVNNGYNPFVFRSGWGLAADGAIAIVSAAPYRVRWLIGGRQVHGPVISYEPVRIDADERDAERYRFQNSRGGTTRIIGPPREPVRPDAATRTRLPDDIFPGEKPPFTETRFLVSPRGELWIPRASSWDATTRVIDIVDRAGRLSRQLRLSANQRVVGFGRSAVYVAAMDRDDLQWLLKVPLPR